VVRFKSERLEANKSAYTWPYATSLGQIMLQTLRNILNAI